jgi:hypothetical protein
LRCAPRLALSHPIAAAAQLTTVDRKAATVIEHEVVPEPSATTPDAKTLSCSKAGGFALKARCWPRNAS